MERTYRHSHTGGTARGVLYDEHFLTPGRYEHELWQAEQALLDHVVEAWVPRRDRLLDFACGTGRVLSHLEGRFQDAVGIDISPSMLERARLKRLRASLVCGDPTRDPGLAEGPFDLVTAFRFFLNAEEALRDEAMALLASRLRDGRSVLFFNVHGNYFSTRQLSARVKRLQGKQVSWMTLRQVHRLVERHGLRVMTRFGRGYLDKFLHKHLPGPVRRRLEDAFARLLPESLAVNLYFVCRRERR
jgi:SAM-dependent methyltransferase